MPFFMFALLIVMHGAPISDKPVIPEKYKKWIEEEVIYIITPKEKDAFYKLESDRERDLFINAFWAIRDPTPRTSKNEFKEEHYRRIAYANKAFARNSPLPGWKTDRGKIYIMLGEPVQILKFSTMQIVPVEIWYYQGSPRHGQPPIFRFLFFQRGGSGEYKLHNPLTDGPRALMPFTASGDLDQQDADAFEYISKNISEELAEAALSCFPSGAGRGLKEARSMALPSSILLGQVHTFPQKKVKDDYVAEFISHEPTVEVSYSDSYISNRHIVSVLSMASDIFFVHLGVEPEVLSIDFDGDKYHSDLKIFFRVIDLEEKTIFQKEIDYPISLGKEQYKEALQRSFQFQEMFPLIPGRHKLRLMAKNELTGEFTTLEEEIVIPEAGALWMSPLILSRHVEKSSPYSEVTKAFQIGELQIYPSLDNHFNRRDTLYLFFQILGLDPMLREKSMVEISFSKGGEKIHSLSKKISELWTDRDFIMELPLEKMPVGRYQLKVTLAVEDKKDSQLLSREADVFLQSESLRPPWVITNLGPPPRTRSMPTFWEINFF